VIGAGRTDTGVHALNQVAHFDFPLNMNKNQILLAIKSILPHSILVKDVQEVPPESHARFDAISRTYKYFITSVRTPFNYKLKTYLPLIKLDIDKLKACIPLFLGEHDFTSFCKPNPEINNHVCNIMNLNVYPIKKDIIIEITANRFLHHLVRRIVGAMLAISHKSLDPRIIKEWLASKKHEQKNFQTAPADGLYLVNVQYPWQ
jgi:tRNA pseudouridine38-40 synthase